MAKKSSKGQKTFTGIQRKVKQSMKKGGRKGGGRKGGTSGGGKASGDTSFNFGANAIF